MGLDRFQAISRTAWVETASRANDGRDRHSVARDEANQDQANESKYRAVQPPMNGTHNPHP